MQEKDLEQFTNALIQTQMIYDPNFKAPKGFAIVWFNVLKKYSVQEVKQGFIKHLETSEFPPKPADIIKKLRATSYVEMEKEFTFMVDMISGPGKYENVIFSNKITNYCVSVLNWHNICLMTDSNEKDWRNRFFKLYQEVSSDFSKYENTKEANQVHVGIYSHKEPDERVFVLAAGKTDYDVLKLEQFSSKGLLA